MKLTINDTRNNLPSSIWTDEAFLRDQMKTIRLYQCMEHNFEMLILWRAGNLLLHLRIFVTRMRDQS